MSIKEVSKSTFGVSVMTDGGIYGVYADADDFHGFSGGWIATGVSEDEAREIAAQEESRRDKIATE